MARPLRIYWPGAWYHVTARGNERRDIFRDDGDRELFLARLAEMSERYGVGLHSYVLMSNHFHLILEPGEDNLSRAMQWLNVSYSQWFNRRHRRSGHLFQGRFKSIVVDWRQWGLELSRYLHLNPVRTRRQAFDKATRRRNQAGVGRGVSREVVEARKEQLRSYPWSSYRAYVGREKAPGWLRCDEVLRLTGAKKSDQRQAYQSYVEEAIREGMMPSPWEALKGQVVLGDETYVTRLQSVLKGDEQEQAELKRLRSRPGWKEAVQVVEEMKGENWNEFRDRRGDWGRDVALWLGRRQCGMKLRELVEAAGMNHYGSVATALRYLEQRRSRDPKLSQLMLEAGRRLKNNQM